MTFRPMQQDTQKSLDDLRYERRRKDAINHSHRLLEDNDTPMILRPRSHRETTYSGFATYHHLLQSLHPDEYRGPLPKKQKTSEVVFTKEDHVMEIQKKNKTIELQLENLLHNCKERQVGGGAGLRKEIEKKLLRETKDVVPSKPTSSGVNESDREAVIKNRGDEIADLEERIRAQTLSRNAGPDNLFYDRLAKRETNTLLEEVLLEDMYELAIDVYDEEEEKSREKELPPDLLEIVEGALHEGPMEEVIVQKYNVDITRRHLQVLQGINWLNDEVINFYFQMMNDRDEELVNTGVLSKRSHFFNSFFYTKVSENGYNFINVRRWTRKIDLFSMDKIFMPVNVGNMHWCMAVIFMTEKRIQYYDSMHGSGAVCLKVLLRYLHDESEHKKKQKFDEEGWELVTTTPDTPTQNNGSDCGVFSCMFADYLSQNKPLKFTQRDIPFHRHRMVLHISRGYIPLEEEGL